MTGYSGDHTCIVIFGATGDLTHRKLIPALFSLYRKRRLPKDVDVVCCARRPYNHDSFREELRGDVMNQLGEAFDEAQWAAFAECIWYVQINLDDTGEAEKLQGFLHTLEDGGANRLYYLATAPNLYEPIIAMLGQHGMASDDGGWRRIIVEKPFGYDLASARALNEAVHRVFDEHQVYRIDHYLGKETVQNILFFRFGNTILEPVWNRNYIDHVQITVAENVDVGSRAGYYDSAGVMRDMFQNHLLQLLCLVAMEPPASFNADSLRNEKVKVLSAVRSIPPQDTVRAQYDAYCTTPNVAQNSQTPTYAALRLFVDNWRWQGVPFYLRSGKALAAKSSEIVVQFRLPPLTLFNLPVGRQLQPNVLSMCIQPDEGIHLGFQAKVPDAREVRAVDMDFHYRDSFKDSELPEAYERLLLDALLGDAALFTRSDEIELAWALIDHLLQSWTTPQAPPLVSYASGSWGPAEADSFIARDGRSWMLGCGHEG